MNNTKTKITKQPSVTTNPNLYNFGQQPTVPNSGNIMAEHKLSIGSKGVNNIGANIPINSGNSNKSNQNTNSNWKVSPTNLTRQLSNKNLTNLDLNINLPNNVPNN